MIHPVVPFAIQGALWYQGESNRGAGMHYAEMMKGLISGWRTVWGQGEFPFLFVQLAPFRYGNNPTWLPEIWEAQEASLAIPNTGMAVTTDIGNINDIHPNNKQEVGRRLSLWALRHTYGKTDLEYSGPVLDKAAFDGGKATLSFKHAAGLKSRDDKPLSWFTIAGEDKKFFPAEAKIEGEPLSSRVPMSPNPSPSASAGTNSPNPTCATARASRPALSARTSPRNELISGRVRAAERLSVAGGNVPRDRHPSQSAGRIED